MAMIKAEQAKLKKAPERPSSNEIIIGFNQSTKYLVQDMIMVFEKQHPQFSAYPQLLNPNDTDTQSQDKEKLISAIDVFILPEATENTKYTQTHSKWSLSIAQDEIILIFGGSGKHKYAMKDLSWQHIMKDKTYKKVTIKNEKNLLQNYIAAGFENLADDNLKPTILPVIADTEQEIIKTIVHGNADYALIYKSMATKFAMLTKTLPRHMNQHNKIAYYLSINEKTQSPKGSSLFAETVLSKKGYYKLKVTGFKPIPGGNIHFNN